MEKIEKRTREHACPVCGKFLFPKRGSYEICPICDWEDDAIQEEDPTFAGGANALSLEQAREIYRKKEQGV